MLYSDMPTVTPIKLRVKELREAKGWTQERLANEADVSRITVIRIESDDNKRIDYEVLEKLANALGVDAGLLIRHDRGKR
jgi:transcriptional regulator with XRE-family HTH domain